MTYFSKFPLFPFLQDDNTVSTIANIFVKGVPANEYKNISTLLLPYQIIEGETPELVSTKFYDTPLYHWVILYFNNITDPRFEWPLTTLDLEEMIYEKYDYEVKVIYATDYSKGDILQVAEGTDNAGKKFIVNDINQQNNTIFIRTLSGIVFLDEIESFNNLTKNTTNKGIQQVILPFNRIKHYVDPETNIVVDETFSGRQIVTVYEYENSINEQKRQIKILDNQYITQFISEFDKIVREQNA